MYVLYRGDDQVSGVVRAGRVRGSLVHMGWARVGGVCGVYDARLGLWHVCGEHARGFGVCAIKSLGRTTSRCTSALSIRTRALSLASLARAAARRPYSHACALCLVSRCTSALFARVRTGEPVSLRCRSVRPPYLFIFAHVHSGEPLYVSPIRTRALPGDPLYVGPIRTRALWRAAVRRPYSHTWTVASR
eukprot:4254878-Prymnesium_polylepis.1